MKRASAALLMAMLGTFAHGTDGSADGPLRDVPALVVLPEKNPKAYSWSRHLEPVLIAARCNRCHDGTSKIIEGRQANRSLTLTETATGVSYEYLFNLSPSPVAMPGVRRNRNDWSSGDRSRDARR
jgi:hypothetical protein